MNKMKNITKILAVLGLLILTSCDFFLQKPDTTGTVDRDAVFGSKKNAQAALCPATAAPSSTAFLADWVTATVHSERSLVR